MSFDEIGKPRLYPRFFGPGSGGSFAAWRQKDWQGYLTRPTSPVPPLGTRLTPLQVILFLATVITTMIAGCLFSGVNPLAHRWAIMAGVPYAATLMTILLVHEMGHYVVSRLHGVPATPPYFIPAPPPIPFGTMGAVIRMRLPSNRRILFDVGAAGPWAGLLVAIPAVVVGLSLSEIKPLGPNIGGLVFGDSILFNLLVRFTLGISPDDATILLHPVAVAGWFGLLVTSFNLLPVGQLDGGHVAYALLGRRHRWLARFFIVGVVALAFRGWMGWLLWAGLLVTVIGIYHPPTLDEHLPLDSRRRAAAWLTAAVFVITFMPVPLKLEMPRTPPRIPFSTGEPPMECRLEGPDSPHISPALVARPWRRPQIPDALTESNAGIVEHDVGEPEAGTASRGDGTCPRSRKLT